MTTVTSVAIAAADPAGLAPDRRPPYGLPEHAE